MAETSSVTTVIIGDHLPWSAEVVQPAMNGRCDPATLHHASARRSCAMRSISSRGATLEDCRGPAVGDAVALELATGQRAAARVMLSERSGELGIVFDQDIDIIALLNRKLVSQVPERRSMPRLGVRCPIHVKAGGELSCATLRNISSSGVQIEGERLPARGTFISLIAEGLNIPAGEVVWQKQGLAGIELFEPLSWNSLVPWVRELIRTGAN